MNEIYVEIWNIKLFRKISVSDQRTARITNWNQSEDNTGTIFMYENLAVFYIKMYNSSEFTRMNISNMKSI